MTAMEFHFKIIQFREFFSENLHHTVNKTNLSINFLFDHVFIKQKNSKTKIRKGEQILNCSSGGAIKN